MLWTIAVVLLILWLLGLVSSYTMGGFIHILLVVAIVVVLIRLIQGPQGLVKSKRTKENFMKLKLNALFIFSMFLIRQTWINTAQGKPGHSRAKGGESYQLQEPERVC